MISYRQALDCIQDSAEALVALDIDITDALGKICAESIFSPQAVPSFDNSAMDGFALRAADSASASAKNPLRLRVAGSSAAGDVQGRTNAAGGLPATASAGERLAWEIMTGAAVPSGFDSVVMLEHVEIDVGPANGRYGEIRLSSPVEPAQNIRRIGEDFKVGDWIIERGRRIAPQHIMALAAVGIARIKVVTAPKVSVICTGKELVDDDAATLMTGTARIHNANGPYLMSALSCMGAAAEYAGVNADQVDIFEQTIQSLSSRSNIIVSTGAVSAGRHDFVPASLRRLGAEILFHKVAIRPGKPVLFARLPSGAYYFGLPGNPVSAAVGLRFFVYPLLCFLQGIAPARDLPARLDRPLNKKPGLRFFRKAKMHVDDNGLRHVQILDGQESFKISPMLEMNCWAVLPEDADQITAGTIAVAPMYPGNTVSDSNDWESPI